MPDLGAPCRIYCAAPPSRVRLKSRPSVGRRTMPGCAREAQQLMTDTDPSPGTTPWFNTDGGRTIIGAAIVTAFMVIVATVVLVGGQANQSPQNEQPGPATTAPAPAPPPPPPPSAPKASPTTAAPAPPLTTTTKTPTTRTAPPTQQNAPTNTNGPSTAAPATAPNSAAPATTAAAPSTTAAPTTTPAGPSLNVVRTRSDRE